MGALCLKSFQDELYEELNKLDDKTKEEKKIFLEAWIKQVYNKEMEDYSREKKDEIIEQLKRNF
jgi:hypothetical protein